MQPARLDLSIIQGATYRQVLRIMQPVLEYRPISAIAPSAPVQLTVDHGLPIDWPVWVRGVTRMPQLNAEPIRQRPHMATVIDAAALEINPLSATGLAPAGGELVYNLPVDLTGATAVLQVLDAAGGELLNIVPTVNAGGWIEVALSDEATAALTWGTGNWLLDISFSNGDVFRAFTGTAKVWPAGTTPTAAGMCAGGWVVTAGGQGVPGGQGPVGPAFQVDATGPTADRALYDSEPEGFSFLDTTTGELFFREGAGWSDGVPFQGPAGISAYQVALNNGFVGTEAEWLEFLQGDTGADGADGVGIAALVINGSGHLVVTYTNAIETDLGLVVGASGADGADGADGAAGVDGRGITSMALDGSGHLIITYDDTTTEDAGLIPGGGSAVWGGIGGTLADQTDLQAALDSKATSAQGALADTAVQPATLTTALSGKVDKDGAKVLSDENYTSAEKSKLAGLESSRFKGLYASLGALQAAHPTASAGDYADVDAGVGSDTIRHVWDVSDAQWQPAGSGAPITAADVKTLYESNPDTNAYTDAEKTKLGTVASNATANPDTDSLTEGATNKWFTVARVLAAALGGLSLAAGGPVLDTDSVLAGFGKLQRQINDLTTELSAKYKMRGVFTSLSANTLLTAAHEGVIVLDATAGDRTLTLPVNDAAFGVRDLLIRRLDNTSNRAKVQVSGADKIKFHTHLNAAGYGFLYLMGAGDWWHLRSDGAGGWWPIARRDDSPLGRLSFETSTAIQPGGYGLPHGVLFVRADWPWVWDHAQASGMLVDDAGRAGFEGCWTRGDGSTTVRSPDVRGEFLRMLDEGRAIDPARVAGSWQKGTLNVIDTGNAAVFGVRAKTETDPIAARNLLGADPYIVSQYIGAELAWLSTTTSDDIPGSGGPSMSSGVSRPRNIAYPARIKLI